MKKFIIVLALVVALFSVLNQLPTDAPQSPQTAIVKQAEQVETSSKTEIFSEISAVASTVMELIEETPVIPKTQSPEFARTVEEPSIVDTEETVKCIYEGNCDLAEYKPQIGGQPNPFENGIPTEIDDRPVEDYVGKGEDRPGEGIRF